MRFWFVKSFNVDVLPTFAASDGSPAPNNLSKRGRKLVFLQEARGWRQGLRPSLGTIRGAKLLVSSFPSTNHHNLRIGSISFTKTRTFLEIFNTLFSLPLISGRFCLRDFWPLFSPPPHLLLLLLPEKPHTHAHTNADTHARAKEPLSQERTHSHTHVRRKKTLRRDLHSLGGQLPALARAPTRPVSVPSGT